MTGTGDRRRTDTRARVRRTALELFTTQGYEATGLAQVADQLGITRPAVYHHFRNKEELLVGSYDELGEALSEVLATAAGPEGRPDALRRLDELFDGELGPLLACAHVNETALRGIPQAAMLLGELDRLAVLLGGETVAAHMRGRLALAALVQARSRHTELGGTPEERRAAGLQIAADLLGLDEVVN